jgi:hypothetical protein
MWTRTIDIKGYHFFHVMVVLYQQGFSHTYDPPAPCTIVSLRLFTFAILGHNAFDPAPAMGIIGTVSRL